MDETEPQAQEASSAQRELNRRLISEVGLSKSYASEISTGRRVPSQVMAIRIYRAIGEKLGPIAEADDEQIAALETILSRQLQSQELRTG